MSKLTEALFSMQCSFIAKNAAAWAGDILTLPEHYNREADAKTVARFTDEMRARLDRLDEWAGRSVPLPEIEGGDKGDWPSEISRGIKTLEWKLNSETQTFSDVFFGRYYVERNPTDRWCWGLSFHGEQGVGLYPADNFEAAKAAAQTDYEERIMSAVEYLSISEILEAAARAGDAAVYEAMRSKTFDPSIPDNVAEFVGNAIRAALTITGVPNVKNAPQNPSCNHVNGGAYRRVSVEEWRELGGDDNKFCDWHEGIGYVVYDDQAREQYRAKMEAAAPSASIEGETKP